jgi:hypothetical protein
MTKLLVGAIALLGVLMLWIGGRSYNPDTLYFNRAGQIKKQMRVFADTVQPTSASGFNLDVSAAGFTQIVTIQCNPELNTATAGSMPQVSVKSWTPTSVSTNYTQANTQVISLLGVNVIGLQALQSVSGVRLHILIIGY